MGSDFTRRRPSLMPIFTVDNDRRRLDLEGIIKKLRTVTTAVQILPFIYCTLYILSVVIYFFGSDTASSICDTLLYVSPITIASFLVLSSVLRLCKWHKTACVIPLIPICQHIALEDGMDPFGEPFAYLGGNISREISDIICVLSCPHYSGS